MKQKFITEIILVNDASTDDSLRIANEMLNQDKRLSLINLKKNSGKGNAVKEALKENEEKNIPSVFSKDGKIFYKLPNGDITQKSPF